MSYEDADDKLIDRISSAMWDRMNINTNRTNGRMIIAGADPDDHINPELKIPESEIKTLTERTKLRDVVFTDVYLPRLREVGFEADVGTTADGERFLHVKMVPPRADEVKFGSLDKLEKKNQADINDDPDIARPYYE